MGDQGDYWQGKRFKRMMRMLTDDAAKKNLRNFKLQVTVGSLQGAAFQHSLLWCLQGPALNDSLLL